MNLLEKLKLRLPIIQAPMAGGIVTPQMIAEVCRCGGLGSLPLGYLNQEEARQAIKRTKLLTNGIFSVNVFIPAPQIKTDPKKRIAMLAHINHYHRRLGLPEKKEMIPLVETFAEELIDIAVNEENVSIVSFTFGALHPKKISELQSKGVTVIGTATTVNEGLFLESIGCDAIIAQGYEAGGHRGGGFLEESAGGLVGTMALIPQMVDAVNIPVIAAGGIMDGRGIVAALALGAQAVQMGTAFVTAKESAASEQYKKMILNANENSTCLTSAYTGKSVRAFRNEYIQDTEKKFSSEEILAYPTQHQMTKEMRAQANKLAEYDYTGFWSGQGVRLSRKDSVADMMQRFEEEMKNTRIVMRECLG